MACEMGYNIPGSSSLAECARSRVPDALVRHDCDGCSEKVSRGEFEIELCAEASSQFGRLDRITVLSERDPEGT